jgi:hypothetical protein
VNFRDWLRDLSANNALAMQRRRGLASIGRG